MNAARHRASGAGELTCTELPVGDVLVVHPAGPVDRQVLGVAHGLAPDPELTVVVLDAPPAAVQAELLDGRGAGFRLVFVDDGPTGAAAQRLADALGRDVVTHHGPVVPVGAAGLFVPPAAGPGWMRHRRGAEPVAESPWFPRPRWAPPAVDGAEALPGGLWLHPGSPDPRHRETLVGALVPQPDVLTLVLGCPGGPPLSVSRIAQVWWALPAPARAMARFVCFGPVATPPGTAVGQALADRFAEPVTLYTGLPAVPPGDVAAPGPIPRAVHRDGRPGWHPYAAQLGYAPRPRGAGPVPPQLLAHRRPVPDVPEIAPGVYSLAPDVVLEVVESGLWMRPPREPGDAHAVRSAPLDPGCLAVLVDAAGAVRGLADGTVGRLEPSARRYSAIRATAGGVAAGGVMTGGVTAGGVAAESVVADVAESPASTVDVPGAATVGTFPARESTAAEPPSVPVVERSRPGSARRPAGFRVETAEPELAVSPPVAEPTAAPATLAPATAVAAPLTTAVPGTGEASPDIPVAPPPTAPDAPSSAGRAGAGAGGPAAPDRVAPPRRPGPQPQATPSADACAVPPPGGPVEERRWLRRTFGSEFDASSGAVAALLSQVPGLRAGSGTEDALADLVAARMYLRGNGAALAEQVRAARPGPHVPMARCVTAGFARLPSYRGALRLVVPGGAGLVAFYRERSHVREWAFLGGRSSGGPVAEGDLDVRIWSSSGRRTALLDPAVPDRVVLLPGTTLRVLRVGDAVVLLREMAEGPDGAGSSFDDLARAGLDRAAAGWSTDGDAVTGPAPGVELR